MEKQTIEKVAEEVQAMIDNYQSFFEKGNKSAGTRARKAAMNVIKLCKNVRVEVQEEKNSSK